MAAATAFHASLNSVNINLPEGQAVPYADSFIKQLNDQQLYTDERSVISNFDHLVKDVRAYLTQQNYPLALACFDKMLELKKGDYRQDGITPAALHEITQFIWLISCLEDGLFVENPEDVMALIFLHDLGEDFAFRPAQLQSYLEEKGFRKNKRIKTLVEDFDIISKKFGKDGLPHYKNDYEYYCALQKSKNASVVKLFDRAHNIMTLVGVKDKSQMTTYIAKTLQLLNDYIRHSIQNFPTQTSIYITMQHLINQEIQTCRYYVVYTGKKIPGDEDLIASMPREGFKNLPRGLHNLILPARRIRATYPEKHPTSNEVSDNEPPIN